MADALQLNLFGDILNNEPQQPEVDKYEPSQEPLGTDGRAPLEEVSSEDVSETSGSRDIGAGTDKSRQPGNGGDIDHDIGRGPEEGGSGGDRSPAVHPASTGITGPGTLRNGHTDDRGNYHVTNADQIGIGGKVKKYEENFAAITLIKSLEFQKRYATPEEQSILVKYTGWAVFPKHLKKTVTGRGLTATINSKGF